MSEMRLGSESDNVVGGHLNAIAGERHFAAQGRGWTVRECIDSTTQARVLIFDGEGIARRVRHYPDYWRELSDEGLYELSWSS